MRVGKMVVGFHAVERYPEVEEVAELKEMQEMKQRKPELMPEKPQPTRCRY